MSWMYSLNVCLNIQNTSWYQYFTFINAIDGVSNKAEHSWGNETAILCRERCFSFVYRIDINV